MTIKEFFNLVGGFDVNSKLFISAKNNTSMIENAVPVERLAIDFDEKTKEVRIILG